MKKCFSEYYRPTDEELSSLFKEAIFVFDTNALLPTGKSNGYEQMAGMD